MPKGMYPIFKQTVTATSVASITFSNIPQTYSDLVLYVSAKSTLTGSALKQANAYFKFNNDTTTSYSNNHFYGTGTGTGLARDVNMDYLFAFCVPSSDVSAQTFGSAEIVIPEYASVGKSKQLTSKSFADSDATTASIQISHSGLWRQSSGISTIFIALLSGSFVQNSTFDLYGISR